ncbi:S41 family peptidase [Gallaecimonas mangrovi]|uniref:S41 family peptidase n=1 Tax=Gallaecimonas mangrovi TaxID=2291597 RepID=UPI000E20B099|nr:S41 family peptidase [Gallaecimonas mangrovi]
MKLRYSLVCCLAALGIAVPAVAAQDHVGYYRQPALNGNTLVFTSEGDIWVDTLGKGQAHRLTSRPAQESGAVLSQDGKTLAFVANYEGAQEAYVMPVNGGAPKRVTFEQSHVRLQGWTHDGHILYSTDNAFGPSSTWILKEVDPGTLKTTTLPLANAVQGSLDEKGDYVYFARFGLQVTGDHAKVYRGGAQGQLWRYKLGSNKEAQLLSSKDAGSESDPMFYQGRLYYVSDKDGNPNLWSMAASGGDAKQLTHFKNWPVRGPSLNDGRIVFQHGADLMMLDIAKDSSQKLDVALASDEPYEQERWLSEPLKYATDAELNAAGSKVVLTARGRVAVAGTDGSRLVQIATPAQSRVRDAVMSKDGKWIYAICDASGEQELWRFAADGSDNAKQLTHDGHTLRWSLSLSPDGRYLANDDNDGALWLFDLKTGTNKKIFGNGPGLGPFGELAWSADSRYLAIAATLNGHERSQVILYDVKEGRQQFLTSGKYESSSPAFSPDGKWLYFLSDRSFNATPGAPWGDRNMGPMFDKRTDIYALALDPKAVFPFQRPSELLAAKEQADDGKSKIAWDTIAGRLWQVPVPSGNYSHLEVTDERLYVQDSPAGNGLSSLKTIAFDRQSPEIETFAGDIGGYQLSDDRHKLLVQRQSRPEQMMIVPALASMPGDTSNMQVQGDQWQLAINPSDEWQQMFKDAWLMHRSSFYDPTMRGVDWNKVKARFEPLVARVSDRYELADLMGQMTSQLNALHSQVYVGDVPGNADAASAASLGAQLVQGDDGVRISHIFETDPELPDQAGPLAKPGVDARNSDVITAINGRAVNKLSDVSLLLRNQAGKQVLLTLARGDKKHEVIVYPVDLRTNSMLRYHDWVEHNRDEVTKASHGKIGYLHLYAMGTSDIESFAREFYANYNKDGLIIDVRRNRGGNIDSWIIDKLMRRVWMFWQPKQGDANTNMQQAFRGHLVVLTDQVTYSDGETFSAGIKALGLAPLIGMRTAGAGVWLTGRNALSDFGMARVAEFPQFELDGHWIVEGHGVEPNIEVDNLPHATFEGKDAQLLRGISYLEKELKDHPIKPLKADDVTKQPRATDVKKEYDQSKR